MKTAVIFAGGVKQIIFTPENEDEKFALSLITAKDDIELLIKDGSFGDKYNKPFTKTISPCEGEFLRVYDDSDSKILVLKPRPKAKK